jgi:hypothetical protein
MSDEVVKIRADKGFGCQWWIPGGGWVSVSYFSVGRLQRLPRSADITPIQKLGSEAGPQKI